MNDTYNREAVYNKDEYVNITLPKECIRALLVASRNYIIRIDYLEKNNRIGEYKLSRIKATNLYDLNKAVEILKEKVDY